jgi:hypothetical protein
MPQIYVNLKYFTRFYKIFGNFGSHPVPVWRAQIQGHRRPFLDTKAQLRNFNQKKGALELAN